MEGSHNPEFLKEKYGLHNAPEVEAAVKDRERRQGEKVPNAPSARIEAYLDRLERLILDPENKQPKKKTGDIMGTERPRALSLLRRMILNEDIAPNKKKMAQGAADVEERAAHEMGINLRYAPEQLAERGEIAVGDLESSLDEWINYLSDPDEPYPTWFRYYAFRNVLNLGEYDKDRQEFPKRSKGTFKLFPDIDRGALAYVLELMDASRDPAALKRLQAAQKEMGAPEEEMVTAAKAKVFADLPFAKQYAEAINSNGEITPELRKETRGEWVRYSQGGDAKALWRSLQNKGTAWCTRGYPTAAKQLQGGDFYVYYTLDATGSPTIPRLAIRMEGDRIGENPRGVLDSKQNVEDNMLPILDEKLKEFGDEAEKFKKISADMKLLTDIENKTVKNEPLTRDELVFLYELNSKIQGFGYGEKDRRISELREKRNKEEDMPVVFGCAPEQIARSVKDIKPDTRAYVGPLEPGIFDKLPESIEHIYTKFPEGKIERIRLMVGGKSVEEYEKEMDEENKRITNDNDKFKITDWAKQILPKVKTSKQAQETEIIRLSVADLGFTKATRYDELCKKAKELGLELCPAEAGPALRLQLKDQPMGDWFVVAMEPLTGSDRDPRLWDVYRSGDGRWLGTDYGSSGRQWSPGSSFVFVRGKH